MKTCVLLESAVVGLLAQTLLVFEGDWLNCKELLVFIFMKEKIGLTVHL
jgi:hypothetical protein